ncbi:MAG TPA: DUF1573 domain-containing protein [Bacteroidales bacterium]|nr:DUF1573 domain-containing protein [Bacteroidales bacterium]
MKNGPWFGLFLYFILTPALSAQQSKPVISFVEKEHNFGTLRESDGAVTHDFVFTNSGKIPLIVHDVKASCGCTSPEWPREPVLPGKSGTIRVSFNPKDRPGPFNKSILVNSNADLPSVALSVKGVVIPVDLVEEAYRFTVGELRLQTIYAAFGEIYKGNVADYIIKVYNTSKTKPARLSFPKVPAHLKITLVPEVIEPLQEGRIEIEYLSTVQKDWDYVVDRLAMLVNGQTLPNNRINITANIKEDFSKFSSGDMANAPRIAFDSTSFSFGMIGQDQVVEHEFKLTNSGKSNLYIRKVSASCGCTAVQPEKTVIEPGGSTSIKTVFNAAGREGNQKKAITVITNDPKRSRTILWINGVVTKSTGGRKIP